MPTLHLVQQWYAHPAETIASAYDLALAGIDTERADGGELEDAMSTPHELGLDSLAVQARLVAKLRAAKAEGDRAWERTRPDAEWEPDDPPEPPMSEQCPTCNNPDLGPRYCGEDTCTVCGEPIGRLASAWWHEHGGKDHMPRPALTWLEIEDRWAEWSEDDKGGEGDE